MSLLALRPGRVGGAETYVRALLRHLPDAARGERLVAVMDRDLAATLETPGWDRVVVPRSARAIVAERLLEAFTPYRARQAERALERAGAGAVLFPQQSIFPKHAPGRAVVTVHDVQHLEHPERFGALDRAFRARAYPASLARADRVVAISEVTRRAVLARSDLAPGRVVTVPHGVDAVDAAAVSPTALVAPPYLYVPGATFPHKNHATLLRTYAALVARGEVTERLVLSGLRTRHWPALSRLVRALGLEGRVVHLGFLPYAEVLRVYAGAAAVLFPSRFEGFGLPAVEAAQLGRKVITSRLEIFDELGVPRELQIDFADPAQLVAALRRPGATALARRPSTWADVAAATVRVLREAAGSATAA